MDSTLIKMNCDVSSAFAVIYVKTKGVARIKKKKSSQRYVNGKLQSHSHGDELHVWQGLSWLFTTQTSPVTCFGFWYDKPPVQNYFHRPPCSVGPVVSRQQHRPVFSYKASDTHTNMGHTSHNCQMLLEIDSNKALEKYSKFFL